MENNVKVDVINYLFDYVNPLANNYIDGSLRGLLHVNPPSPCCCSDSSPISCKRRKHVARTT